MSQRGWSIDLSKCIGCESCTIACKAEWNTAPLSSPLQFKGGALEAPKHVSYRWVIFRENGKYPKPERLFVTSACNHCTEPACLKSCPVSDQGNWENPNNAIIKRSSDGVVLINQDKCIGCKYCIGACPYGAPQFNEATEKVEKCTFCAHRIDDGLQPACVTTCVGRALFMEKEFDTSRSGENAPPGFADPRLTNPAVRFVPK